MSEHPYRPSAESAEREVFENEVRSYTDRARALLCRVHEAGSGCIQGRDNLDLLDALKLTGNFFKEENKEKTIVENIQRFLGSTIPLNAKGIVEAYRSLDAEDKEILEKHWPLDAG